MQKLVIPFGLFAGGAALASALVAQPPRGTSSVPPPVENRPLHDTRERRLRNVRQLTFGGENAEAYWSADGKRVTFQSTRPPYTADQIFTMDARGRRVRRVSTAWGRTTCSFFFPDGRRIVYASTHLGGKEPPPPPDRSQGYVWPVYASYDLFSVGANGRGLRRLTATPGYDAEAVVSPGGKRILFTSARDGDLDLYEMDANGGNVKRLTDAVGYDGGAFYSPDGKMICWRAHHPSTDEGKAEFKRLLAAGLVRPTVLELWVMDRDGGNKRQVTRNGAANFCPYFTPDGKRLIFSSNLGDPRRREFDLYLINLHGTGLERVTYTANAWFGEPTVAATAPARPTSSSPTGWSSP